MSLLVCKEYLYEKYFIVFLFLLWILKKIHNPNLVFEKF